MRAERRRTKKLIVAFHFHRSNQAGWKCDACRKAGLERKRRCGWLPAENATAPPVVWARKRVALLTCPTSFLTAESAAWVEEFETRRRWGAFRLEEMSARDVEAFSILAEELAAEGRAGGTEQRL